MTRRPPPRSARLGAGAYVLWGLMHLGLGAVMAAEGLGAGLDGSELEAESLMFFISAMVIGTAAIIVAVTLNRRNSALGFWLNALLVMPIDIALLAVLLRQGHVDAVGGVAGPAVAGVALCLSADGVLRARTQRRSGGLGARDVDGLAVDLGTG